MKNKPALRRHPWALSVCQTDSLTESWYKNSGFWNVTRTAEEISIVCETTHVPPAIKADHGWCCYEVIGPIAFDVVGVLAGLSSVMADQGISIFAVSTYNTDYILLKESNGDAAERAWRNAGYSI